MIFSFRIWYLFNRWNLCVVILAGWFLHLKFCSQCYDRVKKEFRSFVLKVMFWIRLHGIQICLFTFYLTQFTNKTIQTLFIMYRKLFDNLSILSLYSGLLKVYAYLTKNIYFTYIFKFICTVFYKRLPYNYFNFLPIFSYFFILILDFIHLLGLLKYISAFILMHILPNLHAVAKEIYFK